MTQSKDFKCFSGATSRFSPAARRRAASAPLPSRILRCSLSRRRRRWSSLYAFKNDDADAAKIVENGPPDAGQ